MRFPATALAELDRDLGSLGPTVCRDDRQPQGVRALRRLAFASLAVPGDGVDADLRRRPDPRDRLRPLAHDERCGAGQGGDVTECDALAPLAGKPPVDGDKYERR